MSPIVLPSKVNTSPALYLWFRNLELRKGIKISQGVSSPAGGRFRSWIASDFCSYGLRRDLTIPVLVPAAKIPVYVRPMRLNDVPVLLSERRKSCYAGERLDPRMLIEAGIRHAYVATTESDTPFYVQWLIISDENEKLQRISRGLLPWLGSDEVLLEQGFSIGPFRELGVMPCAISQIAELGRDYGARWALTFVGEEETGELRECQLAGFRPYLIRRESWRLFYRRVSFHLLPRGTPFPFDQTQGPGATDGLSLAG